MLQGAALLIMLVAGAVGDQDCIASGGTCLEWKTNRCIREYVTGLCDGEPDRRCCLDCDQECMTREREGHKEDGLCSLSKGTCQTLSNYCDGPMSRLCGGNGTRQCCEPGKTEGKSEPVTSGGVCPLITFDPTNSVKTMNGPIKVASSFLPYMNETANAARKCNVIMYVSQSFRKRRAPISRPRPAPGFRTQPKRNNHLVGQAVNIQKLDTPNGPCNGQCLMDGDNKAGNCFIEGIKAAGLQWGGNLNPPEPNLIEDNVGADSKKWKAFLEEMQNNC